MGTWEICTWFRLCRFRSQLSCLSNPDPTHLTRKVQTNEHKRNNYAKLTVLRNFWKSLSSIFTFCIITFLAELQWYTEEGGRGWKVFFFRGGGGGGGGGEGGWDMEGGRERGMEKGREERREKGGRGGGGERVGNGREDGGRERDEVNGVRTCIKKKHTLQYSRWMTMQTTLTQKGWSGPSLQCDCWGVDRLISHKRPMWNSPPAYTCPRLSLPAVWKGLKQTFRYTFGTYNVQKN